jgi:hypothetical protein
MLRGHIVCQQGGQAARPFRNKCRDCAAKRPYVRLRPLTYVMDSKPCGSIGAPPERGAQVNRIKLGHVSVPDPCLGQGIPCPWTSLWPGPYLEGSRPHPRDPTRYLGVPYCSWGSSSCVQGFGASSWRSGPTDCILGYTIFSGHVAPLEPSTWWGQVLFTARLEIAARAPCLHTVVRGTPDSGYRQTPLAESPSSVCSLLSPPPSLSWRQLCCCRCSHMRLRPGPSSGP